MIQFNLYSINSKWWAIILKDVFKNFRISSFLELFQPCQECKPGFNTVKYVCVCFFLRYPWTPQSFSPLTGRKYFSWMVAYSWSVSWGVEPRKAWMTAVRLKAFLWAARVRSDRPISHSMGVPCPFFRLIFLEMVTYGSSFLPALK